MTKPQIWVSIFLAVFIILFFLGRITKKEETSRDLSSETYNEMTEESSTELSAEQLLNNFGCLNCHGSNLTGTQMAPALNNLSEHWGKESLLSYLRNPGNYLNEDRFKEYRKKYPSQIMPSFGEKNIKELGKIVDYLLAH